MKLPPLLQSALDNLARIGLDLPPPKLAPNPEPSPHEPTFAGSIVPNSNARETWPWIENFPSKERS